jgi:predicted membrane channel-forming protein YqfA (hemolysin III family)
MLQIITGSMVILITLLTAIFGLGSQILRNHKRKEVEAFSPLLVVLLIINCFIFVAHSLTTKDWYLFTCQIPWLLFGGIFFGQFIYYKKRQAGGKQ